MKLTFMQGFHNNAKDTDWTIRRG